VVIEGIRAMFKSDARNRTSLDINALINDVLLLLRRDPQKHQIVVHCDLNRLLPQVTGDRVQTQQMISNLVTNTIGSMANAGRSRGLSIESPC
jgi:signal transduction histidine kinase